MSLLVVGEDGLIGARLAQLARANGVPTLTTSRRSDITSMALDLAEIPLGWHLPEGTQRVVICAALTSVVACETAPETATRVNLVGPQRIARAARECGAAVIFISTSLVFGNSGSVPFPEDQTAPRSVYGKTKADAETSVLESCPDSAIVRITKVVHPNLQLFRDWLVKLKQSQTINPFYDLTFSPVPLEYVCQQLLWLTTNFKAGVYHLSGDRDATYAEAAAIMADCFGLSPQLVVAHSCAQSSVRSDLGCSRLFPSPPKGGLGSATNVSDTLRSIFYTMKKESV
jgi:dTDP-4-dehydrorhamnose reductase